MSEALESLLDARANIDAAIAALGGETEAPVTGGLDDPLTAPLTVDGLWVPPLLSRLIAATKKKYPDGYTDPQAQIDGSRRRVPVIWPKGLVLQLCRKRDDLTEDQAHMIQFCNPIAFTQTLIDSGHDLNYRPLDFPMLGGFVGVLASLYDLDLPRLERDLRRWFWLRWVVEVDGDTGGV
jgi:hypothetical protein